MKSTSLQILTMKFLLIMIPQVLTQLPIWRITKWMLNLTISITIYHVITNFPMTNLENDDPALLLLNENNHYNGWEYENNDSGLTYGPS